MEVAQPPQMYPTTSPLTDTSDPNQLAIPSSKKPLPTNCNATAQPDCAKCNSEKEVVVEIVAVDTANTTLPIVTLQGIHDSLVRIQGKNMVRGLEQMVKIHKELLELESEIDQYLLDSVLTHNQP